MAAGGVSGGRSLFLTRIRSLQEQLARVQLKCEELEEQNKELCSRRDAVDEVTRGRIQRLKPDGVRRVEQLRERQESERESARRHRGEQEAELQEHQELLRGQEAEKTQQAVELELQEAELMRLNQTFGEVVAGLEGRLADQEVANEAEAHSLRTEAEAALDRLQVSWSLPRTVQGEAVVKMRAVLAVMQEKLRLQQVEVEGSSRQLDLLLRDGAELLQDRDGRDTESADEDIQWKTERLQGLLDGV